MKSRVGLANSGGGLTTDLGSSSSCRTRGPRRTGICQTGGSLHASNRALGGRDIFRFENGKAAELWNYCDDLGLMEQLGAPVDAGAPDAR
jgi:hypothetical protein